MFAAIVDLLAEEDRQDSKGGSLQSKLAAKLQRARGKR